MSAFEVRRTELPFPRELAIHSSLLTAAGGWNCAPKF